MIGGLSGGSPRQMSNVETEPDWVVLAYIVATMVDTNRGDQGEDITGDDEVVDLADTDSDVVGVSEVNIVMVLEHIQTKPGEPVLKEDSCWSCSVMFPIQVSAPDQVGVGVGGDDGLDFI